MNNSIFIQEPKKYSHKLRDMGLIFVRNTDIINKIILKLHNFKFTSIGFYYKTTISGVPKIHVLLIDIFGIRSSQYSIQTLDDLIESPSTDAIAYKCLKIPHLHNKFRSSILDIISRNHIMPDVPTSVNKNIDIGLKRIFGIISLYDKSSSIGIINDVIKNTQSNKLNLLYREHLHNNEDIDITDDLENISSKDEFISQISGIFGVIENEDKNSFSADSSTDTLEDPKVIAKKTNIFGKVRYL
jgi:hypothetical protein